MPNITHFDAYNDLVRFEPFRDFDEFFRVAPLRGLWRGVPEIPPIKTDVSEDEKTYYVKADIPGVKKEDIKVSIDGNQVSITAEARKEVEEKKGEKVLRGERYYGSQYRGFTMESDIDEGTAEAKYENGVLELTLPKKEQVRAKQVAVR